MWRVGKSLGTTIYCDEQFVAVVLHDARSLAQSIVDTMNAARTKLVGQLCAGATVLDPVEVRLLRVATELADRHGLSDTARLDVHRVLVAERTAARAELVRAWIENTDETED